MNEANLNNLNAKKCREDKNFEDTMRFYQEGLEVGAVGKLLQPNDKDITKKNRYNEFIKRYTSNKSNISKVNSDIQNVNDNKINDDLKVNENDGTNICENEMSLSKQDEIDSFFDEINFNTGNFDLDFASKNRKHNKIRGILYSIILIVCLGTIIFFAYKIKLLNKKIYLMQMTVSEYEMTKQKLELITAENKNMKTMIEDLSNREIDNTQSHNQDKTVPTEKNIPKEYVVQKGDTLSSISKKFYGNSNLYTKIIEKNKLASENLSEGQKLLIE